MKRAIPKQKEIEEKYGKPFKEVLGELVASKGQKGAAIELGVPRSTVWYWIQREKQEPAPAPEQAPEPPTEGTAQIES